uniref:Uncharacterized protein n=1 Tax=Arundo donax TaxID=35708 RepID=A0A0A9C3I1_ARUDO
MKESYKSGPRRSMRSNGLDHKLLVT